MAKVGHLLGINDAEGAASLQLQMTALARQQAEERISRQKAAGLGGWASSKLAAAKAAAAAATSSASTPSPDPGSSRKLSASSSSSSSGHQQQRRRNTSSFGKDRGANASCSSSGSASPTPSSTATAAVTPAAHASASSSSQEMATMMTTTHGSSLSSASAATSSGGAGHENGLSSSITMDTDRGDRRGAANAARTVGKARPPATPEAQKMAAEHSVGSGEADGLLKRSSSGFGGGNLGVGDSAGSGDTAQNEPPMANPQAFSLTADSGSMTWPSLPPMRWDGKSTNNSTALAELSMLDELESDGNGKAAAETAAAAGVEEAEVPGLALPVPVPLRTKLSWEQDDVGDLVECGEEGDGDGQTSFGLAAATPPVAAGAGPHGDSTEVPGNRDGAPSSAAVPPEGRSAGSTGEAADDGGPASDERREGGSVVDAESAAPLSPAVPFVPQSSLTLPWGGRAFVDGGAESPGDGSVKSTAGVLGVRTSRASTEMGGGSSPVVDGDGWRGGGGGSAAPESAVEEAEVRVEAEAAGAKVWCGVADNGSDVESVLTEDEDGPRLPSSNVVPTSPEGVDRDESLDDEGIAPVATSGDAAVAPDAVGDGGAGADADADADAAVAAGAGTDASAGAVAGTDADAAGAAEANTASEEETGVVAEDGEAVGAGAEAEAVDAEEEEVRLTAAFHAHLTPALCEVRDSRVDVAMGSRRYVQKWPLLQLSRFSVGTYAASHWLFHRGTCSAWFVCVFRRVSRPHAGSLNVSAQS